MAKLPIIVAPDKRLEIVASPVEKVDAEIKQLMHDMLETMYAAPGIGLAATQVGVTKRVLVIDLADTKNGEKPAPLMVANPEIIWTSKETSVYQEGCLSFPTFFDDVERPAECKVKYLDENNKQVEIHCDGLLATCIQHEIDHLNGIVFVDHISRLKRDRINTKLRKMKKQGRVPTGDQEHLKQEI